MTGFSRRAVLSGLAAFGLAGAKTDPNSERLTAADRIIRGRSFTNRAGLVIQAGEPIDGFVMEDVSARDVGRLFDTMRFAGSVDASLTRFAFRRIRGTGLAKGLIRVRQTSHEGVLEDIIAEGAPGSTALYPVGFALADEAYAITYRRCVARGFQEHTRPLDKYWNGDGFSDERGNRDIRYIDCEARDCTDGGFDLKSLDVRLENCRSAGNKRNYRLWNTGTLRACHSGTPTDRGGVGSPAHFAFFGGAPRYVLDRPVVRAGPDSPAAVLLFQTREPAEIEIRDADISAPAAAMIRVLGAPPRITWSPPLDRQRIFVRTVVDPAVTRSRSSSDSGRSRKRRRRSQSASAGQD